VRLASSEEPLGSIRLLAGSGSAHASSYASSVSFDGASVRAEACRLRASHGFTCDRARSSPAGAAQRRAIAHLRRLHDPRRLPATRAAPRLESATPLVASILVALRRSAPDHLPEDTAEALPNRRLFKASTPARPGRLPSSRSQAFNPGQSPCVIAINVLARRHRTLVAAIEAGPTSRLGGMAARRG